MSIDYYKSLSIINNHYLCQVLPATQRAIVNPKEVIPMLEAIAVQRENLYHRQELVRREWQYHREKLQQAKSKLLRFAAEKYQLDILEARYEAQANEENSGECTATQSENAANGDGTPAQACDTRGETKAR